MDIDKLKIFCTIVKAGSYSEAARALFMSKAGIRTNIVNFENEIGVNLLKKDGRVVSPTLAGKKLFDRSSEIISYHENFTKEIVSYQKNTSNLLCINSTPSISNFYLPQVTKTIFDENQGIGIEIDSSNTAPSLKKNFFHASIREKINEEGVVNDYVCTFEVALYASEGYAKSHGFPKQNSDVSSHRVIYINPEKKPYKSVDYHYSVFRNYIHERIFLPSTELIYAMVKSGVGIGVVSQRGVKDSSIPLVRMFKKIPPQSVDIYLNYLVDLKGDSRIISLKKSLDAEFRAEKKY